VVVDDLDIIDAQVLIRRYGGSLCIHHRFRFKGRRERVRAHAPTLSA
jgi:hypothetical protein